MTSKTIENFPSSFPLGADLDSVAIWKKGEQFVVVMSPPKAKKKKQAAPWVAFDLKMRVYEDGGDVIGECPALDVVSCGNFEQEARTNIQEAVALFLEDCAERSTLDTVLEDCGFREMHKPPKKSSSQYETMHGLTMQNSLGSSVAA